MMHAFDPSTLEAEAGRSRSSRPIRAMYSVRPSQKPKNSCVVVSQGAWLLWDKGTQWDFRFDSLTPQGGRDQFS